MKELEGRRGEVAELDRGLKDATDEEKQLNERLTDLRRRAKPIEELRRECSELDEQVKNGEAELSALQQKRNDTARQRHELETKLSDTRELLQQAETQLDPVAIQKIRQIWLQLPMDVFDEGIEKS